MVIQNIINRPIIQDGEIVPSAELGLATPAEVLEGSTFSSIYGIKQTGTYKPPNIEDEIPSNEWGYAAPMQVIEGVTFSSASGIGQTGKLSQSKILTQSENEISTILIEKDNKGYLQIENSLSDVDASSIPSGLTVITEQGYVQGAATGGEYKIYSGKKNLSSNSYKFSITGFDFVPEGFAISFLDTYEYPGIFDYNSLSGSVAYNNNVQFDNFIREEVRVNRTMEKGNCTISAPSSNSIYFKQGTWAYIVWGK